MRRLEIFPYKWPFKQKFLIAKGDYSFREGVYVRYDFNGTIGIAEIAPLAGFSKESLNQAIDQLKYIEEEWVDRIQSDHSTFYQWLHSLQLFASVEFGLSVLFEDIQAQISKQPFLSKELDTTNGRVPINAVCGINEFDFGIQCVADKLEKGFTTFKLKTTNDLFLKQLTALQHMLDGNESSQKYLFRFDPNGSWSAKECIEFCQIASNTTLNIDYIEQPVLPISVNQFKLLQSKSIIALAADEMLSNPSIAADLILNKACNVLVIKPSLIGSLQRTIHLIKRANKQRIKTVVTTLLDSALNREVYSRLAQIANKQNKLNIEHAHGLSTGSMFEKDLFEEKLESNGVWKNNRPIFQGLSSLLAHDLSHLKTG